jgi:uncharacterized protein
MISNKLYYTLKPAVPRWLQIHLRRQVALQRRKTYSNLWPIDEQAGNPPEGWKGWPEGKKLAVVLTHDVESQKGLKQCKEIVEIEKALGFRSSFNFVAEDYRIDLELFEYFHREGIEIGLHGLSHKGNLFQSEELFERKAVSINEYIKIWGCKGFRAPSMYHRLEWISALDVFYDSSTFDTDPFEPQPDGVRTIFPFYVWDAKRKKGFMELPYTIPQDHTLFIVLNERSINVWKRKVAWIAEKGGMALLITHPDYMNLRNEHHSVNSYPIALYTEFLEHLRKEYKGELWNALPKDVAEVCRKQSSEIVVNREKTVQSVGPKKVIKAKKDNKRKIWIDLDNTPHVPFFRPIIKRLEEEGYSVVLSARDCFQVFDLADKFHLSYEKIGKHYGKNKINKVVGTIIRATQLIPLVARERPSISVSHGSRSQIIASRLFKVPSLCLFDYEYARKALPPTWVMAPELIPDEAVPFRKEMVLRYPGIKEDVYVPEFEPDPGIKKELEMNGSDLVVIVRPPATEAHYFKPESEALFEAVVNYLGAQEHLTMVMLPRNDKQGEFIRNKWADLMSKKIIKIPSRALDGLNLIWYSDLVVSGGGTMNREAAAMGVPVYSIFRGKIGAVDKYLASMGRLTLIEGSEQIRGKIELKRREKGDGVRLGEGDALKTIVDAIKRLADGGQDQKV